MTRSAADSLKRTRGSDRTDSTSVRAPIPTVARRLHDILSDLSPAEREIYLMGCGLPPLHRGADAETLAQDHYFIVVREVGRYVGQAGTTVDLMFVGMVGLIRAADRYCDTHRDAGVTFESYARWWIRHAMERAIARAQRA